MSLECFSLGASSVYRNSRTTSSTFDVMGRDSWLECSLDSLSDDAAEDLASCYKEMIPAMSRRVITPYMSNPSKADIERIQEDYGPLFDHAEFTVSNNPETRSKARRKSTPRKTSESSTPTGLPVLPTKSTEQTLGPLPGAGDCTKEPANTAAKPSVVPKSLQRMSSEGSAPIKMPERKTRTHSEGAASPPPVSSFTFPSLNEVMAEKDGPKSPKDGKHTEAVRPMVKLSQKQRKQMKSTTPVNVLAPKTPPQSSCPWFQSTSQGVQASSPPNTGINEGVFHNSFPSVSSPPTEVPRMIDILRFEEQKVQNMEKVKPKALHVINIEDKAIEELLKLYNAEDNPEERIIASRVLPEAYAAPVWKKQH
uniref:Uncharacterized protein n=1 Tax=Amblyomma triste TaxID=251400 RepID=A0A023GFN4_AMBTT